MKTRKCTKCGIEKDETAVFFPPRTGRGRDGKFHGRCRVCAKAHNKGWHKKQRYEVLKHYSGGLIPHCACCNETAIEFLSMDHIDGNGAAHRRATPEVNGKLARWLKNNKFPGGFRVLCMNCNVALGHYGACPHQSPQSRSTQ